MWECHATDILLQFFVQKFNATKGEFLVMWFQIDGPIFTTASFQKIVMEQRVENMVSLMIRTHLSQGIDLRDGLHWGNARRASVVEYDRGICAHRITPNMLQQCKLNEGSFHKLTDCRPVLYKLPSCANGPEELPSDCLSMSSESHWSGSWLLMYMPLMPIWIGLLHYWLEHWFWYHWANKCLRTHPSYTFPLKDVTQIPIYHPCWSENQCQEDMGVHVNGIPACAECQVPPG